MEQETLYTSSKWSILKALEHGSKSPIDLANEANTSLANVSQQLRLLELAGIVKSERIPNRDKGQPRIIYSLSGNNSYLLVTAPKFVDKKNIIMQEYQLELLKIWFCEDNSLQYYLEKFYWLNEEKLSSSNIYAFDYTDSQNIKVIISEDQSKLQKEQKIAGPLGEKKFTLVAAKNLANIKEKKHIILRNKEQTG
ncbi:MAG: ArsR family transcriptional regulator [Candidatus Woesearchaeota archaeon]